jgi:hypothetical protein
MKLPHLTALRRDDTHRLIPFRYSDRGAGVLRKLSAGRGELQELGELESATNERLLGEAGLLRGIHVQELVYGVSYAQIVNAAFTHAHPGGSRFSGEDRGCWYAAFEMESACAEAAYHRGEELREVNWRYREISSYVDYLADFRADFHDFRNDTRFVGCLAPDSYMESQTVAAELLEMGSAGVVYPCVRRVGGTCVACFRPVLVGNVRRGPLVTLDFHRGAGQPRIEVHREPT